LYFDLRQSGSSTDVGEHKAPKNSEEYPHCSLSRYEDSP
jgi:hypothetical protein